VKSKRKRFGPEIRRDKVAFMVEPRPGEDLRAAVERIRKCPDCDSVVDFVDGTVHVTHNPTCPRLRSWKH
jgi:hypothetical protein